MHQHSIHISSSNAGMTLMELIVATALVGIVMVGAVSIDFAVHSMRKTTADSAGVAMQTSATMLQITSNVAKAVGDALNVGIVDCTKPHAYVGCNNNPEPSFCARQDGGDPNIYTDDTWKCFWKPLGSADPNIYMCDRPAGPGDCTAGGGVLNIKGIGTAACNAADCSTYFFTFDLENTPTFFFNINITNRPYPTKPVDPAKNPAYQLSSRISPIGHSN